NRTCLQAPFPRGAARARRGRRPARRTRPRGGATAAGVRSPQRRTRPRPLRGLGGQGHRHRLLSAARQSSSLRPALKSSLRPWPRKARQSDLTPGRSTRGHTLASPVVAFSTTYLYLCLKIAHFQVSRVPKQSLGSVWEAAIVNPSSTIAAAPCPPRATRRRAGDTPPVTPLGERVGAARPMLL